MLAETIRKLGLHPNDKFARKALADFGIACTLDMKVAEEAIHESEEAEFSIDDALEILNGKRDTDIGTITKLKPKVCYWLKELKNLKTQDEKTLEPYKEGGFY